jgi:hypothetical protein
MYTHEEIKGGHGGQKVDFRKPLNGLFCLLIKAKISHMVSLSVLLLKLPVCC